MKASKKNNKNMFWKEEISQIIEIFNCMILYSFPIWAQFQHFQDTFVAMSSKTASTDLIMVEGTRH